MNILNSYRHIRPKKVKYQNYPMILEKKRARLMYCQKLSGIGYPSSTAHINLSVFSLDLLLIALESVLFTESLILCLYSMVHITQFYYIILHFTTLYYILQHFTAICYIMPRAFYCTKKCKKSKSTTNLYYKIYDISYTGTGKRTKEKVFVNYFYCREYKKGGKKKGEGSHCSVSRRRENAPTVLPLTAHINESSLSQIVFPVSTLLITYHS